MGNNWGCDDDNNCGVGRGKQQETFVNCADIKITPADGSEPSTQTPILTIGTFTAAPSTGRPSTQKPSTQSPSSQGPSTDGPPTDAPSGGCKATGAYKGQANMDQ